MAAALLLASGCTSSRPLTEGDCRSVGEALAEAWRADANGAVVVAETEQFRRFVADEADSIVERWMTQCKAQVGRSVRPAELECLERAKRIEEVEACAQRYGDSGGG